MLHLLPLLARRRPLDVGRAGDDASRRRRLSSGGTPRYAADHRLSELRPATLSPRLRGEGRGEKVNLWPAGPADPRAADAAVTIYRRLFKVTVTGNRQGGCPSHPRRTRQLRGPGDCRAVQNYAMLPGCRANERRWGR